MSCEVFYELEVLGQKFVSSKCKGDAAEGGLQASKHFKTSHIFAKMHWHCRHLKESWLPSHVLIVGADCEPCGPATFTPISLIKSRRAVVLDNIKLDFDEDSVLIAIPLKRKVSFWKKLFPTHHIFHFCLQLCCASCEGILRVNS